jgi:hypothetical protein
LDVEVVVAPVALLKLLLPASTSWRTLSRLRGGADVVISIADAQGVAMCPSAVVVEEGTKGTMQLTPRVVEDLPVALFIISGAEMIAGGANVDVGDVGVNVLTMPLA